MFCITVCYSFLWIEKRAILTRIQRVNLLVGGSPRKLDIDRQEAKGSVCKGKKNKIKSIQKAFKIQKNILPCGDNTINPHVRAFHKDF